MDQQNKSLPECAKQPIIIADGYVIGSNFMLPRDTVCRSDEAQKLLQLSKLFGKIFSYCLFLLLL